MYNNLFSDILKEHNKIQIKKPLIHHITNMVTMNDCANISTALGSLPIMAIDVNEVAEITSNSNALVLNIGTPSDERFLAMKLSGIEANNKNIPIILDPVGVSSSSYRLKKVNELLEVIKPSVIKGNLAEVMALCGYKSQKSKGVDSFEEDNFEKYAKELSLKTSSVVVITGKEDFIYDARTNRSESIKFGTEMMKSISGGGCMTSSIIGSFAAVMQEDIFLSAVLGTSLMNIAALCTINKDKEMGSATFKIGLIDSIYNLNKTLDIAKRYL